VPKKNIRMLDGRPLIVHTIQTSLDCPLITDLVLTTDDPEVRQIAIDNGCQAPFLRPPELATDMALAIPTIQHAVREMESREEAEFDVVVMLQPTTPLRTADDLREALARLLASDADGIVSIVDVDNWHPMKMKRYDGEFLVNYEDPPVENPPRQMLPPVYIVNGAIYATRRDVLMNENTFTGSRCLGFLMPPERSVNIDTELDFLAAEHLLAP
jgi:CMP-N,N'-diacetyllegionaminic acid synthase